MRIPQYDSHISGNLALNPDGTVTRVAPYQPGEFFDDMFWWAGQLLKVKVGDLVTGVYRQDGELHKLDPDTVALVKSSRKKPKKKGQ